MYGITASIEGIDIYLEYETTYDKFDTVLMGIYLDDDMKQNIIEIVNDSFLERCEVRVNEEAWEEGLLVK